jgi:hypothetical protein
MTSVSTLNTAQFEAGIDRLCRRGLEGRTLLREFGRSRARRGPVDLARRETTWNYDTPSVVDSHSVRHAPPSKLRLARRHVDACNKVASVAHAGWAGSITWKWSAATSINRTGSPAARAARV